MSPFVKSLPSYIKDTNHALKTFRDFNVPGTQILFGQRANKQPSTETLFRLAELVLTLNCFSLSGNYCKQVTGVAIGTTILMGPSYANVFAGFIEQQFFHKFDGTKPELYRRYMDDCFGATSCSRRELEYFITSGNSIHPDLKYTWAVSECSIAF